MKKYYLSSASLFGLLSVVVLAIFSTTGMLLGIFYHWTIFLFCLVVGMILAVLFFEPLPGFVFWLAKKLGYDGVELHLTRHVISSILEKPEFYDQLAKEHGLGLSYHQPWTIMDLPARIAVLIGLMPHPKWAIDRMIAVLEKGIKPLVVHSDLISEIPPAYHSQCRLEIVDGSRMIPSGVEGIVFDCYYSLSRQGLFIEQPDGGIKLDSVLARVVWNDYSGDPRLKEVHIYDFCYDFEKKVVKKNLLPGHGRVEGFLSKVILSEVGGVIIVFEISPLEILKHPKRFLALTGAGEKGKKSFVPIRVKY